MAERTADINFTRPANEGFRQRINDAIRAGAGVETRVQGAVGHQPDKIIVRKIIKQSKIPSHQDAAVRLIDHGIDRAIRPVRKSGQEGCVQRTVGVQTGDIFSGHIVDLR